MTLGEEIDTQRRKVDFDTYDISVQQLLAMIREKQIDIAPEYQRHFRWEADRQSLLIESILLGIPVPSLFMATNRDSSWEVVDGVQRISTLIHFAGDKNARDLIRMPSPLRIEGLEKLPSLNGLAFSDLPKNIQVQFMLRPIKVVTLSDKSDAIVRFDLFERLNTGGVGLSAQEIRACVFRGQFSDLLGELAATDAFRAAVRLPPARRQDRTEEECVLRFFAFLHSYKTFDHSVVEFLNNYMKDATAGFDHDSGRKLFTTTFQGLAKVFPNGISRRGRQSTPMNLYEAVAVGAGLAVQQHGRLHRAHRSQWIESEELRGFTTGATNTRGMVEGRIEYCARQFGWTP